MAAYKFLLPKMGESVIEATVLQWHKQVGDKINEHDVLVEVATDKVDSEVPSPVSGILKQILHDKDAVVPVGDVLAIIEIEGSEIQVTPSNKVADKEVVVETKNEIKPPEFKDIELKVENVIPEIKAVENTVEQAKVSVQYTAPVISSSAKYYSPLVMSIAQAEQISMTELDTLQGSGMDGRVTKEDILEYVDKKKKGIIVTPALASVQKEKPEVTATAETGQKKEIKQTNVEQPNTEIIEMDRMRKLIAQHMVNSKKTSAHVSSFVECDVTNIVRWRDKNKNAFQKREGFSLSFMPVFVEAIVKAIKDFPMINVSVDGDKIIKKRDINIGVATALPSGNLIVPVVKQADQKSLLGIAKAMNVLVNKARTNSLQSDDIADGTYTISNIGTFGNIIGTPIINQPQVAIMAVGAITKKPVVLELDGQDVIAIRHMMYLSHTYDHRVVDGMLGGLFVKKVADYLEKFDLNQEI